MSSWYLNKKDDSIEKRSVCEKPIEQKGCIVTYADDISREQIVVNDISDWYMRRESKRRKIKTKYHRKL